MKEIIDKNWSLWSLNLEEIYIKNIILINLQNVNF